ncbi:hypothetical protein BD311DRAFT_869559 [Dichomitus squalens]|uniref:Uncharacterized protein n=1 Tax=Dichomitus squalens TaxID=114155 RepID=A0A4Q9M7M5_9APHY|nr:hypothetical protein BD311DRAFT_869559 [Dichomitus squalens]
MDPRGPEAEPDELHNGWGALFKDEEEDEDYAPSECSSDRLSDASDWDPIEAAPEMPIYRHNTRVMRERLAFSVSRTRTSVVDHVQYERSALMGSEELPRILERWYKVPRASSSRHHHVRPQGARKALEEFALECVEEIVDRELEPLCTVQEVCKLVTRTARAPSDFVGLP